MSINNLKEGMKIKNYRQLCELLDWEISSGNSKIYQLKDLGRYCKWHKDGFKFIIEEIFDTPKENIIQKEGRHSGNWIEYEQFKISYEDRNNIGVYYILKDNDVYIGSTFVGFRQRFKEHYNGYDELMQHTYELLQNGGEFYILYDMTDIKDKTLIRLVENEYIKYFIKHTNYNVINKKETAYSLIEKKEKIKYKTLKVKIQEDKYEQAMQLLIDNGLLDSEEDVTLTNNYILNGILEKFDIKNMPF